MSFSVIFASKISSNKCYSEQYVETNTERASKHLGMLTYTGTRV